jgi:hypothetical protein
MKEKFYGFVPHTCEQCKVTFYSSGHQGGDAGHGAEAILEFSENGSAMNMTAFIKLKNGKEIQIEDMESISLSVFGDWELSGMAIALLGIGKQLLEDKDVAEEYNEYVRIQNLD